jgi:hypothetical protein
MVKLNKREDECTVEQHGWRSQTGRSIRRNSDRDGPLLLCSQPAAIPQVISARRLMRSAALPREIATQPAQRQTASYVAKTSGHFSVRQLPPRQSKIFDSQQRPNNATAACNMTGLAVLSASGYPKHIMHDDGNNLCRLQQAQVCQRPKSHMESRRPSPRLRLTTGHTMTALSGTPAAVNIHLSVGRHCHDTGRRLRKTDPCSSITT